MASVVAIVMVSVLVLQMSPTNGANNGCTFKENGCTYNIHLTHKDVKDIQESNCATNDQQIILERAQNDYDAKLVDMEKNFSYLRETHEQRIKELESTVKELSIPDIEAPAPSSDSETRVVIKRPSEFLVGKDPLTKRLEKELSKLQDELRFKNEELEDTNNKLNETVSLVHEAQLLHFQASQDLLNAENEITTLKRERAVLKNQLKDRIYKLEVSTQEASDCQVKSANMQDQMAELFRSENNLNEELMTVHLRLNMSRETLEVLKNKHSSLKARHDKTKGVIKMREQELTECYLAKTSVFCDFEDPFECGFTNVNDSSDFFDWERAKGQTPTPGTGPSSDHTCQGQNGHFMFIESSAKGRGNNAILYSPLYRGMSQQCVEFFYHMHGKHIGTLNVYAKARGDVLRSAWRAFGNQGDVWTSARLAIPQELAMAGYQIAFEGITEKGYLGDISIDDVSVRDGPCPQHGNLTPVHVEINSTVIIKNAKTLLSKQRKRQRVAVP